MVGVQSAAAYRMEGLGVLCRGIVDLFTTEFHHPFFPKFIKDKTRFPTSKSFDSYCLNYESRGSASAAD